MKTRNFFSKAFIAITLLASTLLITSCEKEDDDAADDTYTVSGNASGSQQNPAVATSATGTLSGSYNARTNMLTYTINWTGLSGVVTVAHFHGPAAVGSNAGPLVDIGITTNGISGSTSGSVTLADSTETHLLNGKVYYNLHTATNPNGEIRGQVITTVN